MNGGMTGDRKAGGGNAGPAAGLTHIDAAGNARMVDVGSKEVTRRTAVARAELRMLPATLAAILRGALPKGDVLAAARVAGILAAKRTAELIPLCHPLPLDSVRVEFRPEGGRPQGGAPGELLAGPAGVEGLVSLHVEAEVSVTARTGAEMEALTAVALAALTVYDMCKAIDRSMEVSGIRLVAKDGGRSGSYRREGDHPWAQQR